MQKDEIPEKIAFFLDTSDSANPVQAITIGNSNEWRTLTALNNDRN